MQKKQYAKPELNAYGSVEQLTQNRGLQPINDAVIVNGVDLGLVDSDGSADLIIDND
ncbi:MAG: hypothetical protein HC824_12325 [Synechococcales cyanobacterium RM1_1_8]|nr:hypothetical protein [Synechococcales cyanobacterium RM1_1_8]